MCFSLNVWSVVVKDIVVWYTQVVNHVLAPEDWPVLSAEIASISLEPEGFFDRDQPISLPPEPCHTDHDLTSTDECCYSAYYLQVISVK